MLYTFRFGLTLVALLLAAGASPSAARAAQSGETSEAAPPGATGRVEVTVEGFKSAKGQAPLLLLNDSG